MYAKMDKRQWRAGGPPLPLVKKQLLHYRKTAADGRLEVPLG